MLALVAGCEPGDDAPATTGGGAVAITADGGDGCGVSLET